MIVWLIYAVSMIYMESVFHIGSFGSKGISIFLPLALIALVSSVQSVIVGITKGRVQRIFFWFFYIMTYLIFAVQTVYYSLFRQPLQIRAVLFGGRDALTDYWREMLLGILKASPMLLLLALPLIVLLILHIRGKWEIPLCDSLQKVRICFTAGISVLAFFMVFMSGRYIEAEFYDEYTEYYAPLSVMEQMGVVTMVQRDLFYEAEHLLGENTITAMKPTEDPFVLSTPAPSRTPPPKEETGSTETKKEPVPEQTEEPENRIHAFELDLNKLAENSAGDKQKEWLAQYIVNLQPTTENEYTGMFEGYNLIFLTAEGFSTYAIHPQLTPTLYKMVNSGFVFHNYYVPLWQTSTSDGEYVNLTGLIPDGQFSMRKSSTNNMPYSLPCFFAQEGVASLGFHNNSLSYYDRYLTHPNLGYDFFAAKLGECSQEEWGSHIFPMENPNAWPASDLEMMQGTIPMYINKDRFHVYYMTISGHMNYSFTGNRMSSKNREAVKELDMSENARAYMACHIELDKALAYLLEELEKAGQLENTVICLSADHYPYGMTQEQYEELAGKDLSQNMDLYRNSLILWNAGMTEPVVVDKACCSIDLLPTLMNLFGFSFDSRMYAGRDIFSDGEGLVIFNNRSFVSDTVYYDKKNKTTVWKKELTAEEQESYMARMQQEVKDRYQFSAYILQKDYYQIIENSRVQ